MSTGGNLVVEITLGIMNTPRICLMRAALSIALAAVLTLPVEATAAASEANIDGRLVLTNSLTYTLRQVAYALGPFAIEIWAFQQGRVLRFFGVIILAIATGLAAFTVPEAFRQELSIGLDDFQYRPGRWSDSDSRPIRYSEVALMELKVERSVSNPSKANRYLVVKTKAGKAQNHSIDGVLSDGGLERLFDQAATSGVQIVVPPQ